MANWWTYATTQGWNPPVEWGQDLATPLDTPITALRAGTVVAAGYHPWGGEVDIATKDGLTEYALHLDQINPAIQPGAQVSIGELLGLSGGQLSGGSHPTDPQYSTGPHVEYGFFQGAAWSGKSIDPAALIAAGPVGGGPVTPLSDFGTPAFLSDLLKFSAPGVNLQVGNPLNALAGIPAAISAVPTQIGHGLADFLVVGEQDIADWLKRQSVAFFVAAIVLLVLFL